MEQGNTSINADQAVTILIADDEPHIRHLVGNKLKRSGYNVIVASNGQECLALAQQQTPALIVTDFQMPGLSGLELSIAIRKHPELAATPVLMLTARGFGLTDQQLAESHIAEVMTKPFSPREMLGRVHALLHASGAGPQTQTSTARPAA